MKKLFFFISVFVLMLASATVSAAAVTNDVVKVGLYYGSNALYSANAQVVTDKGEGFELGYYDKERQFVSLGYIEENIVLKSPEAVVIVCSDFTFLASGVKIIYLVVAVLLFGKNTEKA